HRPQPPRPDKVKIKGNVEQTLLELACGEPPCGRCHWTLHLLADELVVLGLLDTISTVTVWQALKNMTSSPGSSKPGVSPQGGCRVRLAHGGCAADLSVALRSALARGVLRC